MVTKSFQTKLFQMTFPSGLRSGPVLVILPILLAGCAGTHYKSPAQAATPPVTIASARKLVAAGDIACDPQMSKFNHGEGTRTWCRQKATSDLAIALKPDAVLALGDNQYENGTLEKFRASYDPSWGRLKSLTYATPGNHEYHISGAADYFAYFGERAGDPKKGYYSFDLGAWHIISLNSNCVHVGCEKSSPQERWLREDLKKNTGKCTLAFWHAPRFSSGLHGDSAETAAFWSDLYKAGADVVLTGHDHDYERFAPQTPAGILDKDHGIRQFVVGTGGKNQRGFLRHVARHRNPNSEVRHTGAFGVLELNLRPDGYDWFFVAEHTEGFSDSGSGQCHLASKRAE